MSIFKYSINKIRDKSLYSYEVISKMKNFTKREKNNKKKQKIFSTKSIQKIEKITPLKSFFVLSRYLDRLPRYKYSKRVSSV